MLKERIIWNGFWALLAIWIKLRKTWRRKTQKAKILTAIIQSVGIKKELSYKNKPQTHEWHVKSDHTTFERVTSRLLSCEQEGIWETWDWRNSSNQSSIK